MLSQNQHPITRSPQKGNSPFTQKPATPSQHGPSWNTYGPNSPLMGKLYLLFLLDKKETYVIPYGVVEKASIIWKFCNIRPHSLETFVWETEKAPEHLLFFLIYIFCRLQDFFSPINYQISLWLHTNFSRATGLESSICMLSELTSLRYLLFFTWYDQKFLLWE